MEEGTQKTAWLVTVIVVGVVFVAIGALILYRQESVKPESTFELNSISKPPSETKFSEPKVPAWKTYSNSIYNFAVDVPDQWNIQEYPSQLPNGGFTVAFSPDKLPCRTCTYFRNGYYSIRLYNQKTDPEYFKDFQTRLSNAGKSKDFVSAQIGKYKGVITGNLAAFDHADWVFEFSLDAHDGNLKIEDSKLFQHAISSFRFTDLLFNN